MKLRCSHCSEELENAGALLFSPPRNDGSVEKFHICRNCWDSGEIGIGDLVLYFDNNPPTETNKTTTTP